MLAYLIKEDLKTSLWHRGYFFYKLAFFLVSVVISYAIYSLFMPLENILIVNIALIPYLFTAILSIPEVFREDYRQQCLEQIMLSGCHPYKLALAKIVSSTIEFTIIIMSSLLILCASYNQTLSWLLFCAVFLLIFNISSLVVLSASITYKMDNADVINSLIILPLSSVVIIYCATVFNVLAESSNMILVLSDLLILIFVAILSSMIAVLACSYNLRHL